MNHNYNYNDEVVLFKFPSYCSIHPKQMALKMKRFINLSYFSQMNLQNTYDLVLYVLQGRGQKGHLQKMINLTSNI